MHSTVLFTPARKTHTGKILLSFPFDFYGLLLILNGLPPPVLLRQPAVVPSHIPIVSPSNCLSPVVLLMLRGLWTGASIFTLHSVASLQAAQIFIGATSHLAYWWTLHSVDGNRCVKRGPRHGPQVQYMNCVMALAVKMVRELPVEWVMPFYCNMWWILQRGARTFFYFHEGPRCGLYGSQPI